MKIVVTGRWLLVNCYYCGMIMMLQAVKVKGQSSPISTFPSPSVSSSGPTGLTFLPVTELTNQKPSFMPTSFPITHTKIPTFYPFHDDAFKLISNPPVHPTLLPTAVPISNTVSSKAGSGNSNQLLLLLLLLPVIGAAIFCCFCSDLLTRLGRCCTPKDRILEEP